MIEHAKKFIEEGLAATPEHAQTMAEIVASDLSNDAAMCLLWLAIKRGETFDFGALTRGEIEQAYLEVKAAELLSAEPAGRA